MIKTLSEQTRELPWVEESGLVSKNTYRTIGLNIRGRLFKNCYDKEYNDWLSKISELQLKTR